MKTTKKQLKEIQEIEKKVVEVTRDDNGTIINKQTGEPHFKELYPEKKSREVEVKFSFGECAPKLKYQLQQQGFEIPKGIIKDAEKVRVDLLALHEINILSSKQLWKCFKKLSKQISRVVVELQIKDGEIAKHIKTIKG